MVSASSGGSMDKRKMKRLKRKAKEAEDRINKAIINRINELRKEYRNKPLPEPTTQETQLMKKIVSLLNQ